MGDDDNKVSDGDYGTESEQDVLLGLLVKSETVIPRAVVDAVFAKVTLEAGALMELAVPHRTGWGTAPLTRDEVASMCEVSAVAALATMMHLLGVTTVVVEAGGE